MKWIGYGIIFLAYVLGIIFSFNFGIQYSRYMALKNIGIETKGNINALIKDFNNISIKY